MKDTVVLPDREPDYSTATKNKIKKQTVRG